MGDDSSAIGRQGRQGSGCLAVADPAVHSVIDEATGLTIAVRSGEAILDAALSQGIELAHGCRHGVCGACAVVVVEGLANVVPPDGIERNSLGRFRLPSNVRLACRAAVRGPVTIKPLAR
jgi:ferredoxin